MSTGEQVDLALHSSGPQPDEFLFTGSDEIGVVLREESGRTTGSSAEEIPYVTLSGTLDVLELERQFECDAAVYYSGFQRLGDGRLGLLGYCTQVAPQLAASFLLAYDQVQGSTSLLIDAPLPISESNLFSWNPSITKAIVSFGTLFSGLYWVDETGATPVTGTVEAGGKSFQLETAFLNHTRAGFTGTGNADAPAWSPDGGTIAFFASTDSINRQGVNRITGSWLLCLLDVQTLEPQVVLDNIYGRGRPRWSSDSRLIAFDGQVGQNGAEGLWIYSPATDEAHFVAAGQFRDFIWSPDDRALYGIVISGNNGERGTVTRYEIIATLRP